MSMLEISLLTLLLAQILKIFTSYPFKFSRIIGSGGMPSSHAAFVSCLATSIALKHGLNSDLFAVVTVFSLIIIYDAGGVRKAVGDQANVLNNMIKHLDLYQLNKDKDKEIIIKDLKELIGHTQFEVIAGTLLGISTGVLNYFLF